MAGDDHEGSAARDARDVADRLAGRTALIGALALHLAVGSFVLPVGRIAPLWAAVGLGAVWVAVGVAIVRSADRRPLLTLLLPFLVAAAWWGTLTLGARFGGW